ncbi:hypothetical protein A9Q78_09985 [Methylophaga sp. 41_12_T18]|nr:hypothetical protein A9Q78_09985 [Methylophaga sp. 41_12_T18]
MNQGRALELTVGRSRCLLAYFIIGHLLALATVWSLSITVQWLVLSLAGLSCSFIYHCRQHQWLNNGRALTYIKYDEQAGWLVGLSDGRLLPCVVTSSYVTTKVVMLYFQKTAFWQWQPPVLVMFDAVEKERFRHLRKLLTEPNFFR